MYVNILRIRLSAKLGYTMARTWSFNSMAMSSSVHYVSTRTTVTSHDYCRALSNATHCRWVYGPLPPCCVLSEQVFMEPAVSQALSWAVESWKCIPDHLCPPESTL